MIVPIIGLIIIVIKLIEKDRPEINVALDISLTHKLSIFMTIGSKISRTMYNIPAPIKNKYLFCCHSSPVATNNKLAMRMVKDENLIFINLYAGVAISPLARLYIINTFPFAEASNPNLEM